MEVLNHYYKNKNTLCIIAIFFLYLKKMIKLQGGTLYVCLRALRQPPVSLHGNVGFRIYIWKVTSAAVLKLVDYDAANYDLLPLLKCQKT